MERRQLRWIVRQPATSPPSCPAAACRSSR